ncbi:proton-conducting transporter membrane subunit [Vitreimonas flagellata]|uniref:proton-conducting transporter transmembrane domain-containing protein n=1 Tax=Vitreimonas flagellata TaxID=2560861 RepID=UPI001074CE4E|nr:proton-conducting transporter membrane subunit [Vitreimonas flagellata]
MLALTLNPGFVLILAAFVLLATPRGFRAPTMAGAAILALWLLLDHEFGAASAMAQMGLPVVLLNLDALNRIFGIALLIALIPIAIYASARPNRYEDSAILLMFGGAVSALFVGDLISFVAAASLAGLAASWVTFCSTMEDAGRAASRLLIWHGIEGMLFLVGVALHISAGAEASVFARMDASSLGGVFIFAALLIRVGAPLAHVWLKDSVSHASPAGGAALSATTTMLGVYALARLFPAEPALIYIGAAMIVIGLFYLAAEDDLRRAASYGLTAQTGICVALIGFGSPLAMAAAEGTAFSAIFAFVAYQATLGSIVDRTGTARISTFTGLSRAMPITSFLLLGAGLAVSAVPGFALYATHAVALDAFAQWDTIALWALAAVTPAMLFICLALRPMLSIYRPLPRPLRMSEAPFSMLLGAGLATFFCASVGMAPRWLYDLMPAQLTFEAFALDRVAPQLELLGVAGLAAIAFRVFAIAPRDLPIQLYDIDALYRGPLAGAGRWGGVLMLRIYGAWQDVSRRIARAVANAAQAWVSRCDRPYAASISSFVQLASIGAALGLMLLLH